ncbi:hypothetical protein C8Q72DRAFT_937151 [Fomitopsis betulina]|nr:hypothetical protein C8Q72DRAFT_937151 [Fomitopsis betulina]
MARRSKAYASRSRRRCLPTSCPNYSQTASDTLDPDDMVLKADKVSPRKGVDETPTNLADARQKSEKLAVAWTTQIYKRVVEVGETAEEFLEQFAPCKAKLRTACPVPKFPCKVPARAGSETRMYGPLVTGLQKLVSNFSKSYRPSFENHAHKVMKFPFDSHDDETHKTRPDIVMTVPKLMHLAPKERWRNVALVFEAKGTAGEDPMMRHCLEHERTLIQLAKSARNIMLAQGRLYAFTIGIYGHTARIFRFDHAGAVCSPSFNYIEHPDILRNFMWRFTHPIGKACRFLGDDPSIVLGTRADRALARAFAGKHDPSFQRTPESQKAVRRLTMSDEKGNKRKYLLYKLLFVNTGLFSRASTIWEAAEVDEKWSKTIGEPVVIKEAWRQFIRPSEIHNYEDMQEAVSVAAEDAALSLSHIAQFEHGDDLGLRETKKLFQDGHATSTVTQAPFSGESVDDLDEDEMNKFRFPAAEVFGHRTVSASCRKTGGPQLDRGHIRLVLTSVGKPITDFDSTYEMVTALRDAIIGHEQAYKAGMIHRDVSGGNVMIMKKKDGSPGGFIHDFDFSSSWSRFLKAADITPDIAYWVEYAKNEYLASLIKRSEGMDADSDDDGDDDDDDATRPEESNGGNQQKAKVTADAPNAPPPRTSGMGSRDERVEKLIEEQKQRTGTMHFMAVEIHVDDSSVTHEVRHDLESFFWLLVWIVLRHTTYKCCTSKFKNGTWHTLFDGARMIDCQSNKLMWLNEPFQVLNIPKNAPLTGLVESFRLLCQKNHDRTNLDEPWMTHADVLKLFNDALAKPTWPTHDKAKPWILPARQPGSIMAEAGSGAKRSKGTLAFSSQEPAAGPLPSANAAEPSDAGGDQTGTDSDIVVDDERADDGGDEDDDDDDDEEEEQEQASPRSIAPPRPGATRPQGFRRTSTTMSHASGSHEIPPPSSAASESGGSDSVQMHPSGHDLRQRPKKSTEELRDSARSGSRSMGPPPVPRRRLRASQSRSSRRPAVPGVSNESSSAQTHPSGHDLRRSKRSTEELRSSDRSGAGGMGPPPVPQHRLRTSQSQSSSRPAVAGPSTTSGARASKRSRTREDEEEEGDAGMSHSPKRPRTRSQRGSEPESATGSRKGKGKRRAS